jgi:hypothetical protein
MAIGLTMREGLEGQGTLLQTERDLAANNNHNSGRVEHEADVY